MVKKRKTPKAAEAARATVAKRLGRGKKK